MSESARKKQRMSPRISGDSSITDTNQTSTLYNDLHRLANIAPKPVTPFRRAASVGVTPRSAPIRTPGTGRTPRGGPATRPLPARRAAPTTPHAIRALRERANAARTPGHVRRRSGRIQRETPRDILRDLSRVLARDTQPVQPTPQIQPRLVRPSALDLPDIEDGTEPAPRLSMALDDMYDDDSIDEDPPRQSLLQIHPDDIDNGTVQSLEFGRRARSEDPRMFNTRLSGQFGDLNDLTINGEEYEIDGNFINRRRTMNPDDLLEQVAEELDDTTTEIRALTGRRDGRPSDVDLGVFGEVDDDVDEPTFRFIIPPRVQPALREEEGGDAEDIGRDDTQERLDENVVDDFDDVESFEDVQANADLGGDGETAAIADDDERSTFEIVGWESENEAEDDADLQAYREEPTAIDRSLQTPVPETPATNRVSRQRKSMNISRFGHEFPSFPTATVKTLANGFAKSQGSKSKISKDTLVALVQTSDFFFEQVGEDLAAYSQHAGRKMIEESDAIALLKSTYFSLAQKLLPRELLQQLRMEPLPKLKRQKRKRTEVIREGEEDD
ncbi:hypothetical protein N0V90_013007 [Kalmusia sp. IMI 367209]|nr:hypothetical protein N0V90_013007 [Kalmusia sp. IMI 367209]